MQNSKALTSQTAREPVRTRLDHHPAAVYLSRLSPGSRRAMRQALGVAAGTLSSGEATLETFPWHALRYQHTQALRRALADRYAPASANKVLSAVRGVLREAWKLGQMGADDHAKAVAIESVKGSSPLRGRALKSGEVAALFGACDSTMAQGARDAALLALLYGAGLRRSEAAALETSDYDPETGALSIRHGKGNKARTVYATNGARSALRAWLDIRAETPGPIFLAVDKAGNVRPEKGLSTAAVYQTLDRLSKAAGVKRFSPHDCRRSFITTLLSAGASIAVVQKLAGHASVNTTARYDRSDEDAKRRVAEMIHIPFAE